MVITRLVMTNSYEDIIQNYAVIYLVFLRSQSNRVPVSLFPVDTKIDVKREWWGEISHHAKEEKQVYGFP